jgi:hypothetical protein
MDPRIRFRALPAILAASAVFALAPCRASTVSATDYVFGNVGSGNFIAPIPTPTSGNTLNLTSTGQSAVAGYLPCGGSSPCGVFIGGIATTGSTASTTVEVNTQIVLTGASGATGNIILSMSVPFTYTETGIGASVLTLLAFTDQGQNSTTAFLLQACPGGCKDTKSVDLMIPFSLDPMSGRETLSYTAGEALISGESINTLVPGTTFSISVPNGVSYSSALFPLAAVPEPGTAVLLLCGLLAGGGVVLRRHRFRSHSS